MALFFLRCAFWLTIVYASMSWTRDELASGDWARPTPVPAAVAGLLSAQAEAGVAALCKHQPARCLADAARLTALVDGAAENQDSVPDSAGGSHMPAVPMPVPDPRRRARGTMQTQAR